MSTIRANAIIDSAGGNTATVNGVTIALSSQAQAEAGTDNTTLMTPLRVRNALNATGTAPTYACRAWVNFNGTGTVAIRASGNVTSITDNGVGDYTVNFTTAMSDANYSAVATVGRGGGTSQGRIALAPHGAAPTTSAVRLSITDIAGSLQDSDFVSVSIFR